MKLAIRSGILPSPPECETGTPTFVSNLNLDEKPQLEGAPLIVGLVPLR